MNSEQINITLGVSLILRDVINEILFTKKTSADGKVYTVDRELPFRLRYRLNKNRLIFEKDANEFQNLRLFALAKYGEPSEDGKNVVINDPQKQELFKQEISSIIDTPVKHNIVKLEPEDIEAVTDTSITISPDAMSLFIGYMTNDPELQEDLNTKIKVNFKSPEPPEDKTETKKTKTQKKLDNIKEGKPVLDGLTETPKTEEPPAEEVKAEKTPKKKSTTRKTKTSKVTKEASNG